MELDAIGFPATRVWKLKRRDIRLAFRVNDGAGIRILLPIRLKSVLFYHQRFLGVGRGKREQ